MFLLTGKYIGIAAALGSTAAWAVAGVLFKKLGEYLDPIGMTAAKSFFSVLFLLPVVLFVCGGCFLSWNQVLILSLSGVIGIAVGDSLFFAALGNLSPLALSILLLAGPDLFSGIFGVLFLGEMPSVFVWIGILLIVLSMGYFFISDAKKESGTQSCTTVKGVVFGILSIVCTAVSVAVAKPVLREQPVITATMIRMSAGCISLLLFGLFRLKIKQWVIPFVQRKYKWGFGGTVLLVTYGGFLLSMAAVKYLDLVVASTLMALEPLFVLPAMILFGKHKTNYREIFFLVLTLSGIIIITIFNK